MIIMSAVSTEKSPNDLIIKSEIRNSYSSTNASRDKTSSSARSKSESAISESNKPLGSKLAKSEKTKTTIINYSEALRKDAKHPSGREVKSDEEKDETDGGSKLHRRGWYCCRAF